MNYLKLLINLYKLKRNTGKTREQIKTLQEKKLRRLLKYAYANSPYYHKTFSQNGISEENISTLPISAFPVMDKSSLLNHFDELVTAGDLKQDELRKFDEEETIDQRTFKGKYHLVHSSGSTGKPGYFVYVQAAWIYMLLGIVRAALWNMSMPQILKFLAREPHILYVAATDGRYGGAMAVGDGIDGVGAKQLFLDINTPLPQWAEKIRDFKPDMIVGYPSAIKLIGELAEKKEVTLKLCRVVSCGEPLNPGMRDYLEKNLDAEIMNFYGASESLVLGLEENPEDGMYLFDDMNYIEVDNGVMYMTSLYNFVQPLVRYKISDSLTLMPDDGTGRYPFTRAESILGREEDVLWFCDKHGKKEFLHPLAIEGFCVEGLLDYQFVQIDDTSFEMLAETSDIAWKEKIKSELLIQMREILNNKQLDHVRFYVRFTEKILPDLKTGKKRLVVQSEERAAV